MDPIKTYRLARESTAAIVDAVTPDQFTRPTPCTEWNVRELLDHLISTNRGFLALDDRLDGAPPVDGARVGDDFAAVYRLTADTVADAWDEARLDCAITMPFGAMPGWFALAVHTVETVVHGWDLAKATGQPTAIDADLVAATAEYIAGFDPMFWGPNGAFVERIELPTTASPTDRLVASVGRRP